ncbi:TPA: hypothetical protein NR371_002227, partial [Listeria innocua]|nr:hypothetical protein [Listeria innocua]
VILAVDYKNLLSFFLPFSSTSFVIIGCVLLLLTLCIILKKMEIRKILKVPIITSFDYWCMVLALSLIIIMTSYIIGFPETVILGKFSLLIILILIVLLVLRIKRFIPKDVVTVDSNVIDLKDIYDNNLGNVDKDLYVSEIDVTYDLLNRDIFTNQLYEIVSNLNSQNRFVISLEGAWGSGKTTILNNLSKKLEGRKDLIILDEFEPWLFTNQEMLLKNMLEELLENSGLGYSSIKIDKFIQQVSNATLTSSKYKFLNVLFSNNDSMGIKNVKNDIEELLSSTGKRVVYIIDNLDRIESENVLLIFNLIMNVLDIKNIIFILSFDRNQITSIMNENGITNEYLKKIIQMNVSVPMFDKEVIADILHVSTKNIIEKFEAENLLLNNWEDSLLVIAKDVKDLRDLKIFLNSVFMPSLKKSDSLSFKDMLILEYIRITNIALYGIINKQKEYFISQDYPFHMQNTKYWIDPDKFNLDLKDFYKNLFSDSIHNRYMPMLCHLFPYVKIYFKNRENPIFKNKGFSITDPNYELVQKERGICSAKFFDLYYLGTTNEFVEIANSVDKLIYNFNANKLWRDNLKEIFLEHTNYQKEYFEQLYLRVGFLKGNKKDLIMFFLENIFSIKAMGLSWGLQGRDRVYVIISDLLVDINKDEVNVILSMYAGQFNYLEVFHQIIYWLNSDALNSNAYNKLASFHEQECEKIISENISLFQDGFYVRKNSIALYRYFKEKKKPEEFKNYIESHLDEKSIFRVLSDIINVSISDKYIYCITEESMDLYASEEKIDEILENTSCESDSESFVLKVYNEYKTNPQKDSQGILEDQAIELNL